MEPAAALGGDAALWLMARSWGDGRPRDCVRAGDIALVFLIALLPIDMWLDKRRARLKAEIGDDREVD